MSDSASLGPAIERNRRRLWLLCYRMTGERAEADDLCQEAIAKALERASQRHDADATGWLLRIATRCCLDHLRRQSVRRRATQLVDPLLDAEPPTPEARSLLVEDVRYAVVVALQRLNARQRAALILVDVCDRPIAEVAEVLGSNVNATKAILHRARAAVAEARGGIEGDAPADAAVVQAFADALASGSVDALAGLMAESVWGVVDGGGVVRVATRPTRGRRIVARRFANVQRKLGSVGVVAEQRVLSGEPALVVRLAAAPSFVLAVIHVVTRAGEVAALLVDRDPRRLAAFGQPVFGAAAAITP